MKYKFIYIGILFIFLLSNLYYFKLHYYSFKSIPVDIANNRTLQIASYVNSSTPSDSPIIVYGYDWSGEIAYYSQRKALTVPSWDNFEIDVAMNPEKYLDNQVPSAIVLCPIANYDQIKKLILVKYSTYKQKQVNNCEVFVR
jgi:hypothetical protein